MYISTGVHEKEERGRTGRRRLNALTLLRVLCVVRLVQACMMYLVRMPCIYNCTHLRQLDFSMAALLGAAAANAAASWRAILAKGAMSQPNHEASSLSAVNVNGVVTALAAAVLVPMAAVFEGPSLQVSCHGPERSPPH
jgi:Triose-phosphate Transporter family